MREHTLAKQAKVANKSIKKMKLVRQENDEKMKAWEENCERIDKVVDMACKNFTKDGIT